MLHQKQTQFLLDPISTEKYKDFQKHLKSLQLSDRVYLDTVDGIKGEMMRVSAV